MNLGNVLVTGATGMIGRALCARLVAGGARVICLVRDAAWPLPGCKAVQVSTLDESAVASGLAGRSVDVIFHLAAHGVAPADRDPGRIFGVNVVGTDAVVRAAASHGVRAVVYAGSSAEYRIPSPGSRLDENCPLGGPGMYSASKAAAGLWGQALAVELGVAFQWLRLFNVFGPTESPHRLLPTLIGHLAANEAVPLSPGEQVRDFLHMDDVVDALILAAQSGLAGKAGPFNVCSGVPVTVKEIAQSAARSMGKPASLLCFGALEYRREECLWLVGSPAKFTGATGFVPRVSLTEGIARMVTEIRDEGRAE